jgi:hypothetical protein
MIEQPDDVQLAYATSEGRVICTSNVDDFARLHAAYLRTGRRHAGLVLISQQRYSVGERIRRLRHLIATLPAEQIENRVEYLSAWSSD